MVPRILVVGLEGEAIRSPRAPILRVRPQDLRSATLSNVTDLVLGGEALRELAPRALHRLVGNRPVRVILATDACSPATLPKWLHAGFVDVISPSRLGAWLSERDPGSIRPRLPLRDWLHAAPPPCGSQARLALDTLSSLNRLSVRRWADALDLSRFQLGRLCRRHLGGTPSCLLRALRKALALRALRSGMTTREAARLADYANGPALHHAFARRSGRLPRRRSRRRGAQKNTEVRS